MPRGGVAITVVTLVHISSRISRRVILCSAMNCHRSNNSSSPSTASSTAEVVNPNCSSAFPSHAAVPDQTTDRSTAFRSAASQLNFGSTCRQLTAVVSGQSDVVGTAQRVCQKPHKQNNGDGSANNPQRRVLAAG